MKTEHFDNINELFKYLDPANDEWANWCFRGHHNEKWLLTPSAWRTENELFNQFKTLFIFDEDEKRTQTTLYDEFHKLDVNARIIDELIMHIKFENYLLSAFYTHSNKIGLKVNEHDLRMANTYRPQYWLNNNLSWGAQITADRLMRYRNRQDYRFSHPTIFNESLPQHHGTPTRLLDFTANPRKALFFSFRCPENCICREKNTLSCIYALNKEKLSYRPFQSVSPDPTIHLKNAPPIMIEQNYYHYGNKFLHMQEGLFVRITSGEYFFLDHGKWPTIEEAYSYYEEMNTDHPFLRKITYPSSLNKEIYKKLTQCGISISNLMPHYDYVSQEVQYELKISSPIVTGIMKHIE